MISDDIIDLGDRTLRCRRLEPQRSDGLERTALVFLHITPAVAAASIALSLPLGVGASVIASWTLLRRHPLALMRR